MEQTNPINELHQVQFSAKDVIDYLIANHNEEKAQEINNTLPATNAFGFYAAPENNEPKYNEFFTKAEFACKHCGKQIEMNKNLISFLYDVRVAVGKLIIVTSGYRCPEHNKEVGGVPNSQHVLGEAADWKIEGISGKDLQAIALTYSKGRIGGIGRSDFTNYIHTDTRQNGIYLAKWCYNHLGTTIPYYDA